MRKPVEGGAPDAAVLGAMEGDSETTALARPMRQAGLGEIVGDVHTDDMRIPYLQMAFGVGSLAKDFSPGDLVLNGDSLLVHKNEPLLITIAGVEVYWKEYLTNAQYLAQYRPRSFATEAEVHAAGGTTVWINDTAPTFSKAINMKVLIRKPANVISGLFGLTLGGHEYAPARWIADKTAYRKVAPVVLTTAQFALRKKGLLSGIFEVKTVIEQKGQTTKVFPSIRLVGENSPEFIAETRAAFGLTSDGAPEALPPPAT